MKNIFFIFLLLIAILSCDDDTIVYESTGQILGLDLAACPCCGDWLIQIDGEESLYQFIELPEGSDIDLTIATFPLNVQLNWAFSTGACSNHIIIEDITL